MKPKFSDSMDIDTFLGLFDLPKCGSLAERGIALTQLNRMFTHINDTSAEDVSCEITRLYPDKNETPYGYRNICANDEVYECCKTGTRDAISILVREVASRKPVRCIVLLLSHDLAVELFGTPEYYTFLLETKAGKKNQEAVAGAKPPVELKPEGTKPAEPAKPAETAKTETAKPAATAPAAPATATAAAQQNAAAQPAGK